MTHRVLVIGGGMVGWAFAIAAQRALPQARVTVLEAKPIPDGNPDPLDTRASALNLASRSILTAWNAWPALEAQAGVIEQIHVSNQGRFGSSLLTPSDIGQSPLGYVVENHIIGRALKAIADGLGIELVAPAEVASLDSDGVAPRVTLSDGSSMVADLVIVADGNQSTLRSQLGVAVDRRQTGQCALVANVSFAGPQQHIAFERFTAEGPLALLPLTDAYAGQRRFNVVWSMAADRAQSMLSGDDAGFVAGLQRAFGWRLGAIIATGRRSAWILDRTQAREQVRRGFVVAGNAAHGLHPVAGQGLNLSLRDAATLGLVLAEAANNGASLSDPSVLQRYTALTDDDQALTVAATDLLSTLFERRGPALDLPRDAALIGLDMLSPLRRYIARRGTGLSIAPVWSGEEGL